MLGGNAEVEAHNEEDYFRNMSPVDRLKFERELATKREYTPAEASKNIEDTLTGLAYSTPGVANAMSIRDAYEAKERAGKSEPGSRERQQAEAESAMSALSAFLPFSLGKPSPGSASRFGVFVPVKEEARVKKAQKLFDEYADDIGPDEANKRVHAETDNWFGPEGTVLREIRDNPGMEVKGTFKAGKSYDITDVIDHPELFKEYPDLKNTKVRFLDSPQDPRADRYTGSDPKTGEIMIDESFQGNDLRVQLAKLLQYKVNAKEHRINAAREGPNTKIADSNMAIENTEQAIADGIIDEASGREYIRMLQGTLEEGRAVRHDPVVTSGSYAERRGGHAPGTELKHKQRRALESKFWTEKSAGKQEIKAVKTRAYDPERKGFPYGERPRMAGAAVIPHPGTTGEYLKTFIENWKKYGAGRSKK